MTQGLRYAKTFLSGSTFQGLRGYFLGALQGQVPEDLWSVPGSGHPSPGSSLCPAAPRAKQAPCGSHACSVLVPGCSSGPRAPPVACSPWGVQPRPKSSGGSPAGPRRPRLTSVVLSLNRFLMNMADSNMDAGTTVSETVAEEVSLFSATDMILFSLIVGVMTYWFLFRKKKEEVPEFTKIQTT